ncbi:MAG: Acyl-[acyl-carrier-protein]--UDP-N-acetylglucosamine O-acyltransferase [Chlamydiales bacterium]|nr:Acyl-[acyl-carrier-protein]--UDP-N-acetylglucosamine O-acyltransferase [Chlamydiales bacterium]MCH9619766.1 Acyl-[acyl-carrier-protein]--UDP-N-acetylglucosamine O-acyltransferase [Chlamydiales bacterium]MCH9623372.1 Acyl-[acyl-carrier-protein]--UDP-N-acetylglucosamine O-acyltransferase [Chlamydiales bacterium]
MSQKIHPLAVVDPKAKIGKNVTIEPFAVVKEHVTIHDNATIKSGAYIDGHTTIGENSVIWPGAVIGTKTQDRKFKGERTYVKIGKNCEIREFATINSSTQEDSVVSVGEGSLIMAYCHIAHNCTVGKYVTISNNSLLAGHVDIEDYATLGGMTPVHQFVRIGCHTMVGGMSRVTHDVPPYTIGGGIPYSLGGVNRIGLKRKNFSFEVRKALFHAYRLIYRSRLLLHEALAAIENEIEMFPEVRHFVDFCKQTKRGLIGMRGNHQGIRNKRDEQNTELSNVIPEDLLIEAGGKK